MRDRIKPHPSQDECKLCAEVVQQKVVQSTLSTLIAYVDKVIELAFEKIILTQGKSTIKVIIATIPPSVHRQNAASVDMNLPRLVCLSDRFRVAFMDRLNDDAGSGAWTYCP